MTSGTKNQKKNKNFLVHFDLIVKVLVLSNGVENKNGRKVNKHAKFTLYDYLPLFCYFPQTKPVELKG